MNQADYHQEQIAKAATMCPKCRRKSTVSRIKQPPWPGDWAGWVWVPRQQFALRSTKLRVIMVDEEGDLMSDEYNEYSSGHDSIRLMAPDLALKVANVIAEVDGGWHDPDDEEEVDS